MAKASTGLRGVFLLCLYLSTAFETVYDDDDDDEGETLDEYSRISHEDVGDADEYENSYSGDDIQFAFQIEHSFAPGHWSKRGSLDLQFSHHSRLGNVKFSNSPLSSADIDSLKALVRDNEYYRIRLVPHGAAKDQDFVTASVKACALATSGFREMFLLHCDSYGNVVALDYKTPLMTCDKKAQITSKVTFQSKGRVSLGKAGEKPKNIRNTLAPQQPKGAGRKGAQKGQEAPVEKTFFQKYAAYIIPLGVLFFMSAISPAEEGGKGGGKGGGGGGGGGRN